MYLFISKALRKERRYMFPKRGAPMETGPITEPNLTYVSGSTVMQSFSEALHTEPLEGEIEREISSTPTSPFKPSFKVHGR
jgi:hypothetical protein